MLANDNRNKINEKNIEQMMKPVPGVTTVLNSLTELLMTMQVIVK